MIRCLLEHRLATLVEICATTPRTVLKSWRAFWKDRNEETACLTAWNYVNYKEIPVEENHHLPFEN
ncbi:hypothetical protein CFP56_021613 [Quercus suber]|uniref:Uncharacterized protein n=1 Tax=Quercus suber TaxID=58331 RepID=A0AAW0LYI3_QUESU